MSALEDPRAELHASLAVAEVGQPFVVSLRLEGPPGTALSPAQEAPALAGSWAILEISPLSVLRSDERGIVLERRAQVVALEPGQRALPAELCEALGARASWLDASPPALSVSGVLASGEDAPRALIGVPDDLRETRAAAGVPAWVLVSSALVLALLAGLAALVLVRRARARRAPCPPSPLEQLEALATSAQNLGELHVALARLVRACTAADRPGLADEEWLQGLTLAAEVRADLAQVLQACARAKYAGERPTGWAFEETCRLARRVLERGRAA
jgi:hypothetical protein